MRQNTAVAPTRVQSAATLAAPAEAARFGTIAAATVRYGVSRRTLYRRMSEGGIVVVRMGDRPLVDFQATDALLRQTVA